MTQPRRSDNQPPDEVARVLRDQSVIVPQDRGVFELIASWRDAPSNTASAELPEAQSRKSDSERWWIVNATVHIDGGTMEEAQQQMVDWVADHMPSNFVIGWTLSEESTQ